jgi:hypothetical protein
MALARLSECCHPATYLLAYLAIVNQFGRSGDVIFPLRALDETLL